jgi:hypothetical protein
VASLTPAKLVKPAAKKFEWKKKKKKKKKNNKKKKKSYVLKNVTALTQVHAGQTKFID